MKEHLKDYFPDRFEQPAGPDLSKFLQFYQKKDAKYRRDRCMLRVQHELENSAGLKVLMNAMESYGCNFDITKRISCETCFNVAGGYDPDTNQIVLCSNQSHKMGSIKQILMHEMVHMFDYCRAKMDFENPDHIACSEIRAANLTYCSILDSFQQGTTMPTKFSMTHQDCVKRTALASLRAYAPETDVNELADRVDKVFFRCYNDLEPFGRRPFRGEKDAWHSYKEMRLMGYL